MSTIEATESIGGEAPTSADRRRTRTFGSDRVCGKSGCGTVLSIYNDGTRCARHELRLRQIVRGRK